MKKIQIIGNVTKDCDVRQGNGVKSAIGFDVACNTRWKDRATGEKKEKVTYFKCVIWRENTSIAQWITKGTKVYIEGDPDVDCYVNKEGKAVGSVKIIVQEIEFLGGGKNQESGQSGQSHQSGHQDYRDQHLAPTPDDDLPF